jgi:hypothetical protein
LTYSAAHTAGVGRGRRLGCLDQIELLEQLGYPLAALAFAQMVQVRHENQVLLAGEDVVHRRELAGEADRGPNRVGILCRIVTCDPHFAAVGADQRGQNIHHGGLSCAVWGRAVRTSIPQAR